MLRDVHHKLFLLLSIAVAAHAQSGFMSIDCGKDRNYTDTDSGIVYVTDEGYVDAGVNHKLPSETASGAWSYFQDLRSFPNGTRNCYTLPVVSGNKYLVRACFFYGNYDLKNRQPRFDIHWESKKWDSISINDSSSASCSEILAVAKTNRMSVCLVDTGYGEPFISALELRPLPKTIYLEANASQSLNLVWRSDFGNRDNSTVRYEKDIYDRLWVPYMQSNWTLLTTTSKVATDNSYDPPSVVMETAVAPSSGSSLEFEAPASNERPPPDYYFFLHFAELKLLGKNDSRALDVLLNGAPFYSNLTMDYLELTTLYTRNPRSYDTLKFSLVQRSDSTLPPILNAIEVYTVRPETIEDTTATGDVDAMISIKKFYDLINRNWMGDPCNPKDLLWDGVGCTYATTEPSRIVSLKLQHFGLAKEISALFGDLSELKYLDLSMNSLTGAIPDFLGTLPALAFLNLTGNNLSGPVPKSILERASSGKLTFSFMQTSVDENIKKKNSNTTIIVAIIVSVLVVAIFVALGIFAAIRYRRRQQNVNANAVEQPSIPKNEINQPQVIDEPAIHHGSEEYTYAELVDMTNNFRRKIGQGGFGEVYYGCLQNGKHVAVKKLIKEGPKQFNTEAQILTRIYHKNLVPLLGYCKESNNLSLIYDYMSKGSLADRLSDGTTTLTWKERLRIGIDAAQGLDYLHNGCKPAIIHRDVKTSNILLSDEYEAKIADFGISKIFHNKDGRDFVSTAVIGTPGYLDPEYSYSGQLNDKSDVYSFGIVLLELVTGRTPVIKMPNPTGIVSWVTPLFTKGELDQIVDSKLRGDYDPNSAWKFLEVAMACVRPKAVERPTMDEIVSLLKECMLLETSGSKTNSSVYYPSDTKESFTGDVTSLFNPHAR